MYVFVAPCIVNPSLRARGITTDDDREYFSRCLERCRECGIEVVPLPCPETEYLGVGREPGSYLERLNTPDFEDILQECEQNVRGFIDKQGQPLCIVGVDSSPTCGVNTTYYTEVKRIGKGVFLEKFSEIPTFDVKDFSAYKVAIIYVNKSIADDPLFSEVCTQLRKHYFLPFEEKNISSGDHDVNWIIQISATGLNTLSMQLFRIPSGQNGRYKRDMGIYSDYGEILTALRKHCGM